MMREEKKQQLIIIIINQKGFREWNRMMVDICTYVIPYFQISEKEMTQPIYDNKQG